MDFDPRFASSFGQGEEEEEMPPFEVVRHPFAPPHLPFAIQDNINGGFLPGSSPHYPQLFAHPSEAHAAMLDHIQASQGQPAFSPFARSSSQFGPSSLPFGSSVPSSRATTTLASRGMGLNSRTTTPSPSAMQAASGNRFGAQGLGPQTSFAVNQSPKPGATLPGPTTAGGLQLASNKKPTVPTPPAPAKNQSYNDTTYNQAAAKDAQSATLLAQKLSQLAPNKKGGPPEGHRLSGKTLTEFRQTDALYNQMQAQYYLNKMKALQYDWAQAHPNQPSALSGQDKVVYDHYNKLYESYVARTKVARLIGVNPGEFPNCAVGARHIQIALGVPTKFIPDEQGAGVMRDDMAKDKAHWQKITDPNDLRPGDVVFMYTSEAPATKTHVGVYMGSTGPNDSRTVFQSDTGGEIGRRFQYNVFELFQLDPKEQKRNIHYRDKAAAYRYIGPR